MWARQGGNQPKKKSLLFPFSHPHSALLHYITFNFLLLLLLFFIFFYFFYFSGTSLDTLAYSTASPGHVFSWSLTKRHQDFLLPTLTHVRAKKPQKRTEQKRKIHRQGKQKKSLLSRKEALKLHNESQIRFWAEQQCIIRGGGKGKTLLFKVCVFLRDGAD